MAMIVPVMRTCEMANWIITKPLLSDMPPTLADVILFLSASAGLKADKTNDGYVPANSVTTIMMSAINNTVELFNRNSFSGMEAMCLIYGKNMVAITQAMT